ncbi:MAG: dTDP-4-dehydrorhamnose 3,5-epimerase [Chthonomonas sp.]|nr:dTDP-4-dehydrorhamnose 3,5-epimerase [Chthonomonas sp.]
MTLEPLGPAGLQLVIPKLLGDERGWFKEAWRDDAFPGLNFVQMNMSHSRGGVVRGLHYQEPHPMTKLVFVVSGTIIDVAVDIRVGSPTFGEFWQAELSGDNHRQLCIPPGFAHGFEVLSESATIGYMVTERFIPENDRAIRWDDPAIGIPWRTADPVISARDAAAPELAQATVLPRFSAQ